MIQNARADVIAGFLVCAAGIGIAVYAFANFPIGSLRRMGPGMFPMGSGAILSLLGLVLAINSWRSVQAEAGRHWPSVNFEFRTACLCVAGVVAFALLLRPLGLIPAVLAVVGISAVSDPQNTPLGIGALALFLAALATIIFRFGLGMPFPLLAWNWS